MAGEHLHALLHDKLRSISPCPSIVIEDTSETPRPDYSRSRGSSPSAWIEYANLSNGRPSPQPKSQRSPSAERKPRPRSMSTPGLDFQHPSAFQRLSQAALHLHDSRQRPLQSRESTILQNDANDSVFQSLAPKSQGLQNGGMYSNQRRMSTPLALDGGMHARGSFSPLDKTRPETSRPQQFHRNDFPQTNKDNRGKAFVFPNGYSNERRQSIPIGLEGGMFARGNYNSPGFNDPTRLSAFPEENGPNQRARRPSLPEIFLSGLRSRGTPPNDEKPKSPNPEKPKSARRKSTTSLAVDSTSLHGSAQSAKSKGKRRKSVTPGTDVSLGTDEDNLNTTMGSDGDENKTEEEKYLLRPYDRFGTFEHEFDDDQTFREILKVIRCSLYVFLILVMLVGTVAARLGLFLLASDINQSEKARGESVVHLLLCICAPMVYNWGQAAFKILFGGKEWPRLSTFLVNITIELLTTFGTCLLIFRVIPSTDFFRGIIVTFCVFQFPSILKMLTQSFEHKCSWTTPIKAVCNFVAMAIQLAGPVYFLVFNFSTFVIPIDSFHAQEKQVKGTLLGDLEWDLPVALCLTSLSWWENYYTLSGSSWSFMKRFRHDLQETRDTICFLATPLKVALVLLLARYLLDQEFSLYTYHPFFADSEIEFYASHFSLLAIILGSAVLCTYLGGLACKLHMQKTAFAFPLVLSPPASLAVVYLQCRYEFLPDSWHTGTWYCPDLELEDLKVPMIVAAVLCLSYYVIVSQIWFPKTERMAKIDRLFLTPHFNSIFPDFNLTLRRKRDQGVNKAKKTPVPHSYLEDIERGRVWEDKTKTDAPDTREVPTIYVCATMWHETAREMTQLLKSLFRLDFAHCAMELAQKKYGVLDPDYFNMETHIHFDDAYELDEKEKKYVPNKWVRQFVNCMEEAARSVIKGYIIIPSPIKVVTPYGGRLVWTMPGQNKLVVHLKDKNKIRHRKRWSQIMYMYYLLGYKMLGGDTDIKEEGRADHKSSPSLRHRKKHGNRKTKHGNVPFRHRVDEKFVDNSDNTFILTLDGDIDFKPDAVTLLVDRMKKDKKVAAVCGRIHPIGVGPMVWYQKFEYAVSHWLQKATEHVFGCVLCCPGCFSLFRASALMDDNVLKTYTTPPTQPMHYIQYEQGEDRWLCTLLLQQGYRIDYSACADALTYAPESFAEFFNQRRRWSPSTLANILDLLGSWHTTTRLNDNISRLFLLYQVVVMASTIIAPSFLVLMMTYAFQIVAGFNTWWSYFVSVTPVVFYIFICLTRKNDTQVKVGAFLSAVYAVVMMLITVSLIVSIVEDNFGSPNVVFIALLTFIFFVAGLLHPQEFSCLLPGFIYFLAIPANFLLLTVFYLCNVNNVSWGTREVVTKEEKSKKEAEEDVKKSKSWNIFSARGLRTLVEEIRDLVKTVWGLKRDLEGQARGTERAEEIATTSDSTETSDPRTAPGYEADPRLPFWVGLPAIGNGPVEQLKKSEIEFWKFMIEKYLYPLELSKDDKKKLSDDLAELRNNIVFIFIMANLLWSVIALQLQASEERLKAIYIAGRYEPMGIFLLGVFAFVLVLQFFGMIIHAWGTFLHFMSTTHIDWFSQSYSDDDFARYVVQRVAKAQSLEPPADYDDDDETSSEMSGDTIEMELNGNSHSVDSQDESNTQQIDLGFPRDIAMRRPSMPGQFPRLEKIFDHHQKRNSRKYDASRRGSRGSEESGASGTDGSRLSWEGNGLRRLERNRHSRNSGNTMRDRFQRLQELHELRIIAEEETSMHSVKDL